ncbi:hypothetical protein LTR37_019839 [Vermiconidia calcicola]|uniref:Uncharacterized protein n=1 Tax=Vermiconidia calcicola TaxID=1690605 RepID=A0ACC3MD05_9PEZI|nr:hypothetical protein LTR37_019839 [Vermiconidia calcicola]
MFCDTLGTEGLEELLAAVYDNDRYVGQVQQAFSLYSRFRPQHGEPDARRIWSPPGDIPGSNTHPSSRPTAPIFAPGDPVTQTVTIDAHDLFSQLSTLAFLGKRGYHGLLMNIHDLSEGHIRVWRDWLSKQCVSKKWTDGEPVVVHHDPPVIPITNGKTRADSVTGCLDPRQDPNILWVSTRDENVGIKFRVRERIWRRSGGPLLYSSDVEIPVSYQVEFEEIVVRTAHLLHKIEEAEKQLLNETGRSIVFGAFRG